MASISCNEIAEELLAACLAGRAPDLAAVRELVDRDCSRALFQIVVEGLADRFEPRLCDAYADIFSETIGYVYPEFRAADLRARYERVRKPRLCDAGPSRVFVLSRVTLGADIAVTSIMLDAAKKRFPRAEIVFVGSAKAAELFAGDARIQHREVAYPRGGTLRERLGSWKHLDLARPDSIVIDPDSRLTQLGLLPVCDEDNYFFFESRGAGGDGDAGLSTLSREWTKLTFGVEGTPFLALREPAIVPGTKRVAVSLGVGDNQAKRISGSFERELLLFLSSFADNIVIDKGAGGEEAERVDRAIAGLPNVTVSESSFGGFAAMLAACNMYVGYDSAGQHAAAALGIPLVTVFAGFVNERMFQRWRPSGGGPVRVVRAGPDVFAETVAAIKTL